jgi:nucleoid-associated protein YgaU
LTVAAKPDKAYLVLMLPSKTGGSGNVGEFKFQFNPEKFTITKTANWVRNHSTAAPEATMPEFQGAEPRSMEVQVFLDATDSPSASVTKDVERLFHCCTPLQQTVAKNRPSPPFVLFGWGKAIQFQAYVRSVTVEYKLFKQDGTPKRALATLSLEEVPHQAGRQNPTSGALSSQRTHTVVSGDTLQSIAYDEYRDPQLWRAIAKTNSVDDPLRLRAGTTLLLPPADEAAALS